jgi:hypothetical protein
MNPYLIPSLPTGPAVLEWLIRRIPDENWDTPTHPDRFTPREVIAHLADWEPILLGRMKQTLDQPGSLIVGIDEEKRAIERNYSDLDPLAEIERWKRSRDETILWLKALPPQAWTTVAMHNERGELSLNDQANMLLGHDLYHIQQLMVVLG